MDRFVVSCLCAEWCGVCRDYRPAFEALAARFPQARFRWIDIEEDPDAADGEDIETFPTVRIEREGRRVFDGPLPPQPQHLVRLLEKLTR